MRRSNDVPNQAHILRFDALASLEQRQILASAIRGFHVIFGVISLISLKGTDLNNLRYSCHENTWPILSKWTNNSCFMLKEVTFKEKQIRSACI